MSLCITLVLPVCLVNLSGACTRTECAAEIEPWLAVES